MKKIDQNSNYTTTTEQRYAQSSTCISTEVLEALEMFCQKMAVCQKPVYTNEEVLKMFGVCANTLKKYRDNGYISYSRVDDKYFYSLTDINDFLKNNHHIAFHYEN